MPKLVSKRNETDFVDGTYRIQDLVDIDQLRNLFDRFTATTGFTIGFIDHPGMDILIATGWKRICTEFHRCGEGSRRSCVNSNAKLLGKLKNPGEVAVELCENGLVDCATPIIIEGRRIASLATGQMLLHAPDMDFFKIQAERNGFDVGAYLLALSDIEIVDEDRLKNITGFLGSMAQMISESGHARLKAERDFAERRTAEEMLLQAEERFRLIFEKSTAAIVFGRREGGVEVANAAATDLFGWTEDEMRALSLANMVDVNDERFSDALAVRNLTGSFRGELRCRRKDGTKFSADVISTLFNDSKGQICSSSMFVDITRRKETEEDLLRYRNIVSSTTDAVAFLDTSGKYRIVNDAYCLLAGINREELLGTSLVSFVKDSDYRERARKRFDRSLCGDNVTSEEWVDAPKLGMRFIHSSYVPYRDSFGRISGVVTTIRDTTDRKQQEESLRKSLQDVRMRENALSTISQGVLVCGADRKITYANDAFEKITGYSEQEVVGKPCSILQGPKTSVQTIEEMRKALDNLETFHGEIINYRKNGCEFWNDLSISPLFDERGTLTQFIGVQRDVTARKNSERALRESQLLISTVFDSLDEHVAVLDGNGTIIAVNETWRRFGRENGASKQLSDGIGVCYLTGCETAPASASRKQAMVVREGIQRVLMGSQSKFESEYSCHSPEVYRWFNMRVIPLRGSHGGALVIHENITERKKMEHERSENIKKLSAVSRRLVAVQEDARRRLAAALHDSTSPNLAAIRVNNEVASMALEEGKLDELAARMEDTSALVEETVASIREICADLRPSALDYAGLVPALEAYASQFSRRTGIEVSCVFAGEGTRLSSELESVFFRLFQEALTNIAKHAMAKTVEISLRIDTQPMVLKICDDGRGFDLDSLGGNTGLGLINMREMCEFSGGKFGIVSGKGAGTCIRVEFGEREDGA